MRLLKILWDYLKAVRQIICPKQRNETMAKGKANQVQYVNSNFCRLAL